MLGSFKVVLDGADVTQTLRTRKESAIFAYLVEEAPRSFPREMIAELFWPDRPGNYARMNLRQALLGVRKTLGGDESSNDFLKISDAAVQFNPASAWWDTGEFTGHLQATVNHAHTHLHTCEECVQQFEQAVGCYHGDFLDGVTLGDVNNFQEWLVVHRERYFRHMLDALRSLSKIYSQRGSFDHAYRYAWRYVDLAPLEESAHRQLMRILTLSGRRNAALQQYQFCKAIIQRELGIEPSAETKQLYANIKGGLPVDKLDTGNLSRPVPAERPGFQRADPGGSLYDPSTQIPLQPLFMDRLQHALIRMERSQNKAALFVIAVTYPLSQTMPFEFKKQVEQHLVRRLVGSVREGDTVALLQEDQYGLILEDISDPLVVPQIAEKIKKNVGPPISVQGQRVEIKLTIGISVYPADGTDATSLLNQADIAMRNARLQNKDYFHSASS